MTRIITYDTEFIEDGYTIDLVSFGAVDNYGNKFYAISNEFDSDRASEWVRDNVLDKLPPYSRGDARWMNLDQMRQELETYLLGDGEPIELWAWYGAYDHVLLAQLFGTMQEFPPFVPMFTHELVQLWEDAGKPSKPKHGKDQHDALADARWNMELYKRCREVIPSRESCTTASQLPTSQQMRQWLQDISHQIGMPGLVPTGDDSPTPSK